MKENFAVKDRIRHHIGNRVRLFPKNQPVPILKSVINHCDDKAVPLSSSCYYHFLTSFKIKKFRLSSGEAPLLVGSIATVSATGMTTVSH